MNFDLKIVILVATLMVPALSYDDACFKRKANEAYNEYVLALGKGNNRANYLKAVAKYKEKMAEAHEAMNDQSMCGVTGTSLTTVTTITPIPKIYRCRKTSDQSWTETDCIKNDKSGGDDEKCNNGHKCEEKK